MNKPAQQTANPALRHTYELLLNQHRISLVNADAELRRAMQEIEASLNSSACAFA